MINDTVNKSDISKYKDDLENTLDAELKPRNISAIVSDCCRDIFNSFNPWILTLLIACCLAGIFTSKSDKIGLDDIQTVLFPIIAVCVWLCPRKKEQRIPLALVVIALSAWLFFLLNAKGYIYEIFPTTKAVIARLDGDKEDLFKKSFLRAAHRISQKYKMPEQIGSVFRNFENLEEAQSWLNRAHDTTVVLFGNKQWINLLVSDRLLQEIIPPGTTVNLAEQDNYNQWLITEAAKLKINLQQEAIIIKPQGLGFPLLLVSNPEVSHLAIEPQELTLKYLTWLLLGLGDKENYANFSSKKEELAIRRSYLSSAATTYGYWQSQGPLGFAWFFVGNIDLFSALLNNEEKGFLSCANFDYRAAVGKAISRFDPTITAAVLNNFAISNFLRAQSEKDYSDVKADLFFAFKTVNRNGQLTRAGKIAFLNLMIFEKAGIKLERTSKR